MDQEWVPLAQAAQATCAGLDFGPSPDACTARLAAIALASIAPIYRCAAGTMVLIGGRELRSRVYQDPPLLQELHIGRHDLRSAITKLREARELFG